MPTRASGENLAGRARRCALRSALVLAALAHVVAGGSAPDTSVGGWPVEPFHLVVTTSDGEVIVDTPLPDDLTWSVEWRHSVAQVAVVDTFAYRDGVMLVTGQMSPHLDIAGLGAFAGRGSVERLPDGRYWLRDLDFPLHGNAHGLIIGTERAPSVLVVGERRFELSRTHPGVHARMEVLIR